MKAEPHILLDQSLALQDAAFLDNLQKHSENMGDRIAHTTISTLQISTLT